MNCLQSVKNHEGLLITQIDNVKELHQEVLKLFDENVQKEIYSNEQYSYSVYENNIIRQKSERTIRHVKEYGYSFFKLSEGDKSFTPIPEFLQQMIDKVCNQFGHTQNITNVIVTYYGPGYQLEPHVDYSSQDPHPKGFHFGEQVYGVVLEPDEEGHLYYMKHEGKDQPPMNSEHLIDLDEKPGTAFCMQGKYRENPFHHGVTKVKNQRISITFREVIFKV